MCLKVTQNFPYNKSKIRWKVLQINKYNELVSNLCNHTWWLNVMHVAQRDSYMAASWFNIGFHVYITKKDAIQYAKAEPGLIVAKVEVTKFIAAGTYEIGTTRNETWKYAKLLEVYTASGRHNITKRFHNGK